jgi:hypothetical protein
MKQTFILIAFLLIPICSFGKVHKRNKLFHRHSRNDTSMIVHAYTDSLSAYKTKLDSLFAINDSLEQSRGRYFHLFTPLTFYHSAANSMLSLDTKDFPQTMDSHDSDIDRILMNIYLHRPDLVLNSESKVLKSGSLRQDVERPLRQKVLLAERTAPRAVEPTDVPMSIVVKRPNFWSFSGDYYLQLIQNYVSDNWYKGGENNYSMEASATLEADYNNKSKVKFENKLELRLGFQTTESDTLHKFKADNDLIRYTGKLGLQASTKWYYTLQLVANTQFSRGYKNNDNFVYADFMSPFNLNISLGMDYKVSFLNNNLTGTINLAPFAYNLKRVSRLALAVRNGINDGHHSLQDYGSEATVSLVWNINSLVKWQTRLYTYTTYHRTEVECENTFTVSISKFISAKMFVYPRFDDGVSRSDLYGYWQYKEYSSLGLSLSL